MLIKYLFICFSGLQCLLATPTIVKFFTENYEEKEAQEGPLWSKPKNKPKKAPSEAAR